MALQLPETIHANAITVYDENGVRTIPVRYIHLLGHVGGSPDRPGPWGVVAVANNEQKSYAVQELTVIEHDGETQWFNCRGNITEQMNQWLADNHYTWPLTPEQYTHFTLRWL